MHAECLACRLCTGQVAKPSEPALKPSVMQVAKPSCPSCSRRAVGPTLKPSDGFKTVHALRRSLTYIIYTHMLKPTYMYKIGVTLCGWIEVPAMYRTVYESPLAGTLSKFKPQTQITVSKRLNYAITSPTKVLETY